MDITALLVFLAIGAVAGWLAGTLMKGGGFGLLGNIIVGILGAVVGGYVFGLLGIAAGGGLIGSIVTATVGAALLLFIVKLIKKV
ncbi:MAG TPA: GlsB/YeaQ/YmgE family stress response membrane protein [Methylophaga sp.]|nr:MAG: GlsB/YeaQ/YmgE family stress response membrane protein [Gammaproteobacteria bacterium]HHA18766.1 GlsB/YeaQ/YmgE family stress response membrane protein [Methylophaga sp.]